VPSALTRHTIWPATTIPQRHCTHVPCVTANTGCPPGTANVRSTGDRHAQQLSTATARRSNALRHLRQKVWPRPLLFLANRPLFKEVRGSLQGPPRCRRQMAVAISRRLRTGAERFAQNFPGPRSLGTRSLRIEQVSVIELALELADTHARPVSPSQQLPCYGNAVKATVRKSQADTPIRHK